MRSVDNPEHAVLAAAKDMLRRGLVEGTAGNISARRADGNIVITPSSVDYEEMQLAVFCGGEVRCTDYAASGTPDVGENAVKALDGRGAALLANHGMVAVGPRPDKALHITALVERTAQITWGARALGGPVPLPDEVNKSFANIYAYLREHPM